MFSSCLYSLKRMFRLLSCPIPIVAKRREVEIEGRWSDLNTKSEAKP